jgi:hypothetical protein
MKGKYVPQIHWTSPLRSRAWHKRFDERDFSVTTFTIQDEGGFLRKYFTEQGHKVKYLKENATFHIQVAFTLQAVNSTFTLGTEQIKMVSPILYPTSFVYISPRYIQAVNNLLLRDLCCLA